MKKKIALSLVSAAAVAAIAAPLAVGHASVSLLQPQGSALAGKSGTWILRVPNERDSRSTFKVTLNVPTAIQSSVSVRQSSQWAMTVVKGATAGISQVTWKAKTAGWATSRLWQWTRAGWRTAAARAARRAR